MRQCKQCRRVLDALDPVPAAGPALGESYVLLPTAISPRGMRNAFASLTQSTIHDPWESALLMSPFPTSLDSQILANMPENAHFNETSHVQRPPPQAKSMAESIIAVATHADLSDNVRTLHTYHAHCSGQPVQTPACKECVDTMLAQIDSHAERARYEKRSFAGYLHSTGSSVRNEEVDSINEKIQFYEEELRALEENLQLMETERSELLGRQKELDKESNALAREEIGLWRDLNELQFQEVVFHDCHDSAKAKLASLDQAMAGTRAQNVLNEVFHISQKGPFGTINGFRMGQLPTEQVEWNEINAALGESAQLLVTLSTMLGLDFADFKIVPVGSFSKIIRISNLRMEYRLHGSDQDNFTESHFNLGLGAWVTCLGQLISHVEAQDRTMRLPYKVSKHTVGGYSVLYLKNKHAEWTKALRYALTDLKWLLAWTAKKGTS